MVQLVHRDQAGFIPTRNTATNVRRLLRIMGEGQHATPSAAILSVDIEKALDILERPYLFSVLRQFGLGWTRVLYIGLGENRSCYFFLLPGRARDVARLPTLAIFICVSD